MRPAPPTGPGDPCWDTLITANNNALCLELNLFPTLWPFLENSMFHLDVFSRQPIGFLLLLCKHFQIFHISPVFLCPERMQHRIEDSF